MDINERFDEISAKMDELKAKAEKASEEVKESWNQGLADFKADMEFTMNSIDEIAEEAEKNHDLRVEKRIDDIIAADEKIEEKKEERAEKRREKLFALRDRINELAQDINKADQEQLIIDLLDYADECQETAVYMAEEAALAYKAAAEELVKYNAKYGK